MRIAHVSDFYLPRLGGVEMHVHDLATRQLAAGHTVEILTSTPGSSTAGASTPGVSTAGVSTPGASTPDVETPEAEAGEDSIPVVRRLTEVLRHPRALHPAAPRLVAQALREGKYDVVHAHSGIWSPLGWAGVAAAVRAGIPAVVTLHSLLTSYEPMFRASDLALRWTSVPVQLTAVSDVAAAPLRRLAGPDREVIVLPNGIDPDEWRITPEPRRPDQVVVAGVMRLALRKRPLPLLRMLRRARRALPAGIDLRAVIVGDGRQRAAMERYLRRHGMDWVELPGRLPRSGIRAVFQRADLFVAPATLESFGIAALEARCSGLPVLARAGSGVGAFVVDGQDGLLAGSDADMVGALVRLAGDPGERERMAMRSRKVPVDLGWPAVLRRTEAAYAAADQLARTRSRSPTVLSAAG
jgi:glycosyltransferase involved in cell wall biosynthesis